MTPRSANRALLQSCADTCVVTCVGTPTASSAIPPLLDLSAVLEPARTDLRCISEQWYAVGLNVSPFRLVQIQMNRLVSGYFQIELKVHLVRDEESVDLQIWLAYRDTGGAVG